MKSPRKFGKLPARYQFNLNPHASDRMSRCPLCRKSTYPRKFALLIHVDGWTLMTQGKTCKFCPKDQLIICNQDELDAELTNGFASLKPETIGNDYMVLGTVDMKFFKQKLNAPTDGLEELLSHAADFQEWIYMNRDPGGWRHADADPAKYIIPADRAAKQRKAPWTTYRRGLTQ